MAQAVTAAGRDDMLPVLTGVRIEIDGSTISLLATDRFRLSHRELGWDPRTPDDTLAALVPAKVLGDTAKSLTSGSEVTIALATSGTGEGLIGFEGAAAGGTRRTTTRLLDGEFPKVRSLFPSEHLTVAKVDKAALIESVRRVSLVAERNTAVQLAFADGVLTLDAGSGDEAQASESIEAEIDGEAITTGFNPQFLLDGLTAIDEADRRAGLHPVLQAGRDQRLVRPASTASRGVPLPADAAPPALLTGYRPLSRRRSLGCTSVWSGSARWAATCAPGCATPAITVVGYDRNPDLADVGSLAEMVEALPGPDGGARVVWVMVPAGDPTRDTISELGDLLGEGDLVVDGGNSKYTDDAVNAAMLGRAGHRLRRLRRLRRRLGPGERLRPDVRRLRRGRRQGAAGLRRAAARGRLRLRARRQEARRRPLRQDGPQRHRVRHDAGLRRGLGAARGGRRRRQRRRGLRLLARPAP